MSDNVVTLAGVIALTLMCFVRPVVMSYLDKKYGEPMRRISEEHDVENAPTVAERDDAHRQERRRLVIDEAELRARLAKAEETLARIEDVS